MPQDRGAVARWLSQRVNLGGVSIAARALGTPRGGVSVAVPHIRVRDASQIDWVALRRRGLRGVVFDKDNTLTRPYAPALEPHIKESVAAAQREFDGRVAILSNSAGLVSYDPRGDVARAVEERLGLGVIRHAKKKPELEPQALLAHFDGVPIADLVFVGDRTFTDVAFGNRLGCLTIRVEPFTTKGENLVVRFARWLEGILEGILERKGCIPPHHARW